MFCGRQSLGGHNVIWGLSEALKVHNPKSVLLGFFGVGSLLIFLDLWCSPFPCAVACLSKTP